MDKIESSISNFGVFLTGFRNGDILIGSKLSTKHSIIKVHGQSGLNKKQILEIKEYPDLWDQFKIKLKSIQFFNEIENLDEWIMNNLTNEVFMSDNIEIEFINLGSLSEKIEQEDATILLQKNPNSKSGFWKPSEIESKFPRKPGSRAAHHTLVMHRDFWKISLDHLVTSKYDGIIIPISGYKTNINDDKLVNILEKLPKEVLLNCINCLNAETKRKKEIIIIKQAINVKDVGFEIDNDKFNLNKDSIKKLLINNFDVSDYEFDYFENKMKDLSPSSYKSLIQKLIRYQSNDVLFYDKVIISTEKILILAIAFLSILPGSFVPDIQRYVTGLESVTKRLAVIAVEDSYINYENIYHLLICALVSQRIKWLPTKAIICRWINIGIYLLNTKCLFKYDISKGLEQKRILFDNNDNFERKCSALIDELKSFEGDLAIFRNLAYNSKNGIEIIENIYERPKLMKFEHFVDQHWSPGIALFHYHENININRSKPFEQFFKELWTNSSSYNPRKLMKHLVDYSEIQNYVLISLNSDKRITRNKYLEDTFKTKYTIDKSWLAALIGIIEINYPIPCYVTLNSFNIYEYVAIKRPSRDMDMTPLDEETKETVINSAIDVLSKGVLLNKAEVPFEKLKGAILYLREGKYIVKLKNAKNYYWEDLLTENLSVPFIEKMDFNIQNALTTVSDGISEGWKELLNNLIDKTDIMTIRRVLMYLVGFKSEFEINKISRDGGSIKHQVTIQDPSAYKFFLEFSMIVPLALNPIAGKIGYFNSSSPVLLWKLRDYITDFVSKKQNDYNERDEMKWPKIYDKKERELWIHQKYILESMISNFQNRGHFIWLKVGMGKTLIVLKYIEWLQLNNKLPKYIIYVLPKSAIKTVIEEIGYFNLDIHLQIPTKTYDSDLNDSPINITVGGCEPKPYTITMISSDNHLRLCSDELLDIIHDSLFIVDEVHKALNDTQRSSVAIQLSNLAKQFISFTGTPIIDQHTYKLIWWLEQIVPFEVNEKNFFVAANSMITRIADTKIPVDYKEIVANIFDKKYYDLVPISLGGHNYRPTISDLKEATEISYDSCDIELINITKLYMEKGVMVVAKNKDHQQKIYDLLIENDINPEHILLMKDSVNLLSGDKSPIKIVIVPIQKSEGYNLTKMQVMVTEVYPSNQATRTQLEGRINRIGQTASILTYITIHTGILTRILKDHKNARSLNAALESMVPN